MSEDVKARLAAAGWSNKTRGGYEIVECLPDGCGGFVGIVRNGKALGCFEWSSEGGNVEVEDGESVWDLVPLPPPVAVQDEQPVRKPLSDERIAWESMNGTCTERELADELIAARKRIAELERITDNKTERIEELCKICETLELRLDTLRSYIAPPTESTPVQKLATSGPSITRPVPAVDAWVTYGESEEHGRYRVDRVETINGATRLISGQSSMPFDKDVLTGPSDRGPWRPIGEVR